MVRHYQLCAEQDQAPDARSLERRGVHIHRGWGGMGSAEIKLDEIELDELDAALRAFMERTSVTAQEPEHVDNPVDESSRGDTPAAPPTEIVLTWQRRADAFMDLVRVALAHLGDTHAPGADRYLVHVVVGPEARHPERLDGTPMDPARASRMACDASSVTHHHGHDGETLRLGRRTPHVEHGPTAGHYRPRRRPLPVPGVRPHHLRHPPP